MVLKDGSLLTLHKVEIDAEYNSDFEYFDFDSDMEPWTISRAMYSYPHNPEKKVNYIF